MSLLGKFFIPSHFIGQQPAYGLDAVRKLDPIPLLKEETGAGHLAQQRDATGRTW